MKIREGRSGEAQRLRREALAALDRFAERATYPCRVFSPVAAMQPYFSQNPMVTARRWLDAAQAEGDVYETALAMSIVSVGQLMEGDTTATETAEGAVRAARRSGSPSAIAYCLFCLAQTLSEDDRQRALQLLEESRRSAELAANAFAVDIGSAVRNSLLSRAGDFEAAAWAFLDVAQRSSRDGRRDTLAVQLFNVAGCLAARDLTEPAVTLWGYTEALLGPQDPFANVNLAGEAQQALTRLSAELGPGLFDSLKAHGSLMGDDEALRYAEGQVMRLGPRRLADSAADGPRPP
jgi:hypothetical protein